MRHTTLHTGDLIRLRGTRIYGVIMCERRVGVYDVHIFLDNCTLTFPRGMLSKLDTTSEET
jgi:hypothetical protein